MDVTERESRLHTELRGANREEEMTPFGELNGLHICAEKLFALQQLKLEVGESSMYKLGSDDYHPAQCEQDICIGAATRKEGNAPPRGRRTNQETPRHLPIPA